MISKGKRIKKLRESHNMTQDQLMVIFIFLLYDIYFEMFNIVT